MPSVIRTSLSGRLQATFSCRKNGDHWSLVLESRGGTRGTPSERNPDYSEGLVVLLERLSARQFVVADALLDSREVARQGLSEAERRLAPPHGEYPLQLSPLSDARELAAVLQRSQKAIGSRSRTGKGGNTTKRIRLVIRASSQTVVPADLEEYLASGEAGEDSPHGDVSAPEGPRASGDGAGSAGVGGAYRTANEEPTGGSRDPFEVDPAEVERGLRGHAKTQNAVAAFVESLGAIPKSPGSADPNFDLLWELGGRIFVAEVKSTTSMNEEKQLRLGLGQVLRYRQLLASRTGRDVVAVLVAEHEPRDPSWRQLCDALSVLLVSPDGLQQIALAGSATPSSLPRDSSRRNA